MSKSTDKGQLAARSKGAVVTTVEPKTVQEVRTREEIMLDICEHLSLGESLEESCRRVPDSPHPATILTWAKKYPDLGQYYADAREKGYTLLGDKIERIAAETHAMITIHAQDADGNYLFNTDGTPLLKQVLAPLSSDVIASKRLQVDTLKWKLSKMLPKVYGDKVTQEITGRDGGAVQVAAVDLRGLSDDELAQMQLLMSKAVSK